jgi:arabinogalactan oligomer/maltooligosaccharide transport system permease protein
MSKSLTQFTEALTKGDFKTKLSILIMGSGSLLRGQWIKGLFYLGVEALYLNFILTFALPYFKQLGTLGTAVKYEIWNADLEIFEYVQGDNSMLILLFSLLSIFITIGFLYLYIQNINAAYKNQLIVASGKKLPNFLQDLKSLLDENYHKTLLILPTLGIIAFTILPLIFMILIAFTNFDRFHQPPGNLFTWVGFENFKDTLWENEAKATTVRSLFVWTMVWAFFATFTNYFFGMVLAMIINRKTIKLKKFWRTIFVVTIAVPQFVSLMLMSRLLHELGPLNVALQGAGLVDAPIPFLTNGNLARIVVIVVNMWVGIPYTMLITTGILMNIPAELYESAKIDGAGPWMTYLKITMPYMLFVSGPYLITQFIGNVNNFNVIYLLTGGGPLSLDYFQAGKTDLLVTWLYKLTVTEQNYSMASTIGIIVFILSGFFALIAFNTSSSVKKEEEFQ